MEQPHEGAEEPRPLPEVNQVTLVGRLANEPTLKSFGEDKTRAHFMLAVPRPSRGGVQGKRGSDFVPVSAWRALAKQAEGLSKGDGLRLEGRVRTWQDETKRHHWEVEADTLEVVQRGPGKPQPKQQEFASA